MSREFLIDIGESVRACEACCFGGTLEAQGPLGSRLDGKIIDEPSSDTTWEKSESEMVEKTLCRLIEKSGREQGDFDLLLGGDLMNQCTSSGYGASKFDIAYLGLYGACSTFAEGLIIGSAFISAGLARGVIASASSHFCTAERQYRFPLSYGAFPQSTSQHTVTGCGAVHLEKSQQKSGVFITRVMPGIVVDAGITNASNMGAAMVSAAASTLFRFLDATCTGFDDYDLIATGDLGKLGLEMLRDMAKREGYTDEKGVLCDCGTKIYDIENQDVSCGGSGCGCSAVTFCADIFPKLREGRIKKALLIGTGAMMSPQSLLQGLSIPAVAHLVEFTYKG